MILLVNYDLKVPGRDYSKLYDVLKTAPAWWHHLESTWLLWTNENHATWSARIRQVLDSNDYLFVVDITGRGRDGWLPTKAWEWISEKERSNPQ